LTREDIVGPHIDKPTIERIQGEKRQLRQDSMKDDINRQDDSATNVINTHIELHEVKPVDNSSGSQHTVVEQRSPSDVAATALSSAAMKSSNLGSSSQAMSAVRGSSESEDAQLHPLATEEASRVSVERAAFPLRGSGAKG
jgi:hypothetical protein